MKESFNKIEGIIKEIIEQIEQRLRIEQIDLNEYDEVLQNSLDDDEDIRNRMLNFREKISTYKIDRSFWDKDIPNLISLLDSAEEKIEVYRKDVKDIGGKDKPNTDIVNLLQRGMLTTDTPISKTHKGKEIRGRLTTDGFLELEINGTKKKMSLRRAAIFAWGSDPANQWIFWEAPDKNGETKSLEYFKNILGGPSIL